MENQLQAARRIYNMCVTEYNTIISTLQNNIVVRIFKFDKSEYFEDEEEIN